MMNQAQAYLSRSLAAPVLLALVLLLAGLSTVAAAQTAADSPSAPEKSGFGTTPT